MKLTNYQRDAFVRAVMQDVPKRDFQEEADSKVLAYALGRMPAKVREAYDAHPEWIRVGAWRGLPGPLGYTAAPSPDSYPALPATMEAELQTLAEGQAAQDRHRRKLRDKLNASIYSCNTLKQARELLPEFEKYLPSETQPTKQLPAVADLVADLTQAGWPKTPGKG